MSNIDFSIFGSTTFSSILHELEFNKILNFNSLLKFKDKKTNMTISTGFCYQSFVKILK